MIFSNVLSSGSHSVTNLAIRRVSAEAVREEPSPLMSVLIYLSRDEQVSLYHLDKTFYRQVGSPHEPLTNAPAHPPLMVQQAAVIDGRPVEAFRWTNNGLSGALWIDFTTNYFPGFTNLVVTNSVPFVVSPSLAVGSLAGSNKLVVATEQSSVSPLYRSAPGTTTPLLLSNVLTVARSTLLSMTFTNFPDGIFQIPSDYREVHEPQMQRLPKAPPLVGHGLAGSNYVNSIRQRKGKGLRVFQLPQAGPDAVNLETQKK